jgi:hypothetical protein
MWKIRRKKTFFKLDAGRQKKTRLYESKRALFTFSKKTYFFLKESEFEDDNACIFVSFYKSVFAVF